MSESHICDECKTEINVEEESLTQCGYYYSGSPCEKCGHCKTEHDHYLCDDCSQICDACNEIFCSAYNRKLGMSVCDNCYAYQG